MPDWEEIAPENRAISDSFRDGIGLEDFRFQAGFLPDHVCNMGQHL